MKLRFKKLLFLGLVSLSLAPIIATACDAGGVNSGTDKGNDDDYDPNVPPTRISINAGSYFSPDKNPAGAYDNNSKTIVLSKLKTFVSESAEGGTVKYYALFCQTSFVNKLFCFQQENTLTINKEFKLPNTEFKFQTGLDIKTLTNNDVQASIGITKQNDYLWCWTSGTNFDVNETQPNFTIFSMCKGLLRIPVTTANSDATDTTLLSNETSVLCISELFVNKIKTMNGPNTENNMPYNYYFYSYDFAKSELSKSDKPFIIKYK